jgi:hypothetical protein
VRRAQRLHQIPGLGLKRLLGASHRAHLLDQTGVGGDPLLLDLVQLAVHPRQRLLDRPDQVVHRPATQLQVAGRRLLELAQLGPGQIEEGLVVLPQRLGRERGERLPQPGLGPRQQGELLRRPLPLGLESGEYAGGGHPAGEPGDQRSGRGAERDAEEE